MKIKVIDLLVKIANNEEVPKKIKTDTGIFKLEIGYDQLCYRRNDNAILTFDYYIENNKLNNEVEIIEEPKKIEKLRFTGDGYVDYTNVIPKINELIDEINNLKEK